MYKNITQNSGVSTTPLSRVNIAQETKINQKSLCTSLKRLRDKEFLTYDDLKVGRNGWASYRMNKELMQDIKLFLEENS